MNLLARTTVLRYGVAVLAVALATGLRLLLDPVLGNAFPFATLFLAVLVVAWYGGFGPAVAATTLGAVAAVWLLLSPHDRLTVRGYQKEAGLALYMAVGLGTAALGGAMRAARQRAEADAATAVLQREEMRTTLASIGDAVLVTDAGGRVVSLNPVAEVLTGWATGEAAGKPLEAVFDIVNERTRQRVESPVARVLREGAIVGLANHTVLIGKDGTERPIDDSAAPVRDAGGTLIGVVLVFRDVTDRRRAEEAHRRLAAIVESSDDAIVGKDMDGTITSWNSGAERLYGYPAAEMLGKPFSLLVPPDRAAEMQDSIRRLQRGEQLDHFETVRRRKDGTLVDVSVSYSPVKDDEGNFIGTAVITRDITMQKRAEAAAREWERHLQLVTDSAPVFLAHCDSGHRYKFVNRPYAARFGLEPRDVIGRTIAEVLGDEAFAVLAPHMDSALGGRPVRFEVEIPYRVIGTKVMRCAYEPEFDGVGRVVGYVGAVLDVTEGRQVERALREAEARFAAVVNHAPACVFAKDRQGRYLLANRSLARLVGREPEEFPGRTDYDFFPREVADEFSRDDAAIIESGQPRTYEESFPQDGVTRTYLTVKFPLRDETGTAYAACAVATEITDLKRVQEALRSTAERLNLALGTARLGDWSWDAETDLVTLSDRAADVFGIPPGPAMTWTRMQGLLHEDDRDRARRAVERAVAERGQYDIEYRVNRADGALVWVAAVGHAHYSPGGEPLGMFGIVQDVTARKRAEEALRQSEERSRTILESITDAFYAIGRDWRFTYLNRQAEALLGRGRDELIGKNIWEEFPAAVGSAFDDAYHRAVAERVTVSFEVFYPPHDRWYEVHAYPSPDGLAVYFRDISERRRLTEKLESEQRLLVESEGRLRLREEQLSLLTDALPVLISYVDADQHYRIVNRGYEVWFGHPRHEIQGKTLREVLGESAYETVRGHVEAALAGREVTYESRIPYRDGGTRFIRANYIPHNGSEGEARGFFALVSDITEMKRAEQDAQFLADASASLAELLDYESTLQKVARLAVPHFADWATVDVLGEDGTLRRLAVAHVDPAKVELAHELHRRFPADQSATQGVWSIIRTGKSEIIPEITDDLLAASVQAADLLRIMRALGLRSYMGVPLSVRGKVLGVITFVAAETGRRYGADDLALAEDLAHRAAVAIENTRLYQEVREADRRKDEFLAVLGHELRNPLAPISNALQVLKLPGANGRVGEHAREMMERQVQHMVRLVDDLLDVSRIVRGKVELRNEPIELADVVARAVETSQPLVEAEGHDLTVALPAEPLQVSGDLVRLAQVVGNLLNNAARYTDRGGKIRVDGERVGDKAVLRVRDTGIGIAADVLPRIWEMFVQADRRMKGSHGGMGIGLALVKGLVELHGGTVEAKSEGMGKGSEFVVTLPLLSPQVRAGTGLASGTAPGADARRVLVVDDNVDAAESLAMLLRLGGHEVRVAYDGSTALKLAEEEPPEVAFLDIGMPVMNGYELARQFRERPALRNVVLVALTGWGQDGDRHRTKEAGFDGHEVKPVSPEALAKVLGGRLA